MKPIELPDRFFIANILTNQNVIAKMIAEPQTLQRQNKHLITPKVITMILSITNSQIEAASVVASKVGTIGRQIFAAMTSEKAQHVYKSIIIAVALTVAVIVIGLSNAAAYYWSEFVKPGSIVAVNYTKDKASKAISQVQLSEWIELAQAQAIGIVAASIVGISAASRGVA